MKKAIIVGASSGIGNSLAEVLIENDYKVGITGRRKRILESLKKSNPKRISISAFDCSKGNNSRNQIYVTDVRPGFVDTDMAKGEGQFGLPQNKKSVGYVTKRWRLISLVLKIVPNGIYKRM